MSPRVRPETAVERIDRKVREREAHYSRVHKTAPGRALHYDPDSGNSWFRDMALVAARDQRKRDAFDNPALRGRDPGEPNRVAGPLEPLDLDMVQARLAATAEQARFDLSAAGATALIPTAQLPAELAAEFEVAARNRGVLANALGTKPIPDATGMTIAIARLSGGASVAVQAAEGDANSSTDPTLTLADSALCYASGELNVPRQLIDRAGQGTAGTIDKVLAAELGSASAERLDSQILSGTNTSGQARGLLNVSGISTTTYTSGSPSVAGCASKIGAAFATVAAADGQAPDTLLLHPRRLAWLLSQTASGDDPRRTLDLFERVIPVSCLPATRGTGTNEDVAVVLRSSAVEVFTDARLSAHPGGANSGTLSVKYVATLRVGVVTKAPAAVGIVGGTGFANPSFA